MSFHRPFISWVVVLAGVGVLAGAPFVLQQDQADDVLARADKAFAKQNYQEAAQLYRQYLAEVPRGATARTATEKLLTSLGALRLWDEVVEEGEAQVRRTAGTPEEARAERMLGNLYLDLPHWGTRSGGEYLRGRWEQGQHLNSYVHDKRHAVLHLERARDLFTRYEPDPATPDAERVAWRKERLEALFDLVQACASFGPWSDDWTFWRFSGMERDDEAALTSGEDDFQEQHSHWELSRQRPLGLRLDPDGQPILPRMPEAFAPTLPDDEKILWLLAEVRELDPTADRAFVAQSLWRQATLAKARFGMERVQRLASTFWISSTKPFEEELEEFKPWELADDEAIVLAGGKLRRVTLPPAWNVLGLLREITDDVVGDALDAEALYGIALYHQSRQQYEAALAGYALLLQKHDDHQLAKAARLQVERIKKPEVSCGDTSLQPVGRPATLSITHRNVDRIWLTARAIDLEGYLEELREEPVDPDKGHPYLWSAANWDQQFVTTSLDWPSARIAGRHLGTEIARWSVPVERGPGMRYASLEVSTPLSERGTYLVTTYAEEPPEKDEGLSGLAAMRLGTGRAVVVLSDLAMVEKPVKDGVLVFVCDAGNGQPVANARVDGIELYSVWDRKERHSRYFTRRHEATTDAQGLALLRTPEQHRGQFHVLVKAAGADAESTRLAWSGMRWWGGYHPSSALEADLGYVVTDRPVYRPGQQVRYKSWLRERREAELHAPAARTVEVTISDPRGNEVHRASLPLDDFGAIDGSFTLSEEASLGLYSLRLMIGRTHFGGGSFRVEEYKKPEFEVTVDPGAVQAKLGEKLAARVQAQYLFGAPVAEATVSYRVFREEYQPSFFEPGPWDWLYGPGYGICIYETPWIPGWHRWSWGFGPSASTPVRELVAEGQTRLGADGSATIEIDTAAALRDHPDRDHRYVVQADVRDASRRVVSGEGSVVASRHAAFAMLSTDRGWIRPGDQVVLTLRCRTASGGPVKVEGVVTVSSIGFMGEHEGSIRESELQRFDVATDENGVARFQLRPERSGQLRIRFEAPDAWGGTLEGQRMLWVCGEDFQGEVHRFNDLELISDRRSYEPGDVAHLMVNARQAGAVVLLSDDADNGVLRSWRVLKLEGHSAIVDVPIGPGRRPNFFVDATTVSRFRIHQQVREIFVPPEEAVLKVDVATDQAEYDPGETCTVTLRATDLEGRPVEAQLCVSAFDRAVLAIQPELAPPIAKHFHGQLRRHHAQTMSTLTDRLAAHGALIHPHHLLVPAPEGWSTDSAAGPKSNTRDFHLGAAQRQEDSVRLRDGVTASAAPGSRPQAEAEAGFAADASDLKKGDQGEGTPDLVQAEVRTRFADTAAWLPAIRTDAEGHARCTFEMPENLTTWKLAVWGATSSTKVGQATTSAITTKNLLVRLQAPRFFVERDEVVLSANVHNYLPSAKKAQVSIELPEGVLAPAEGTELSVDVEVPAGGERRVDWRVRVLEEGSAEVAVSALTDEESDAMKMSFPVLVHGSFRQVATTGSIRPDELEKTLTVEIDIPADRRSELTRLEVRFAPSLAGAMLDALPYCLEYPYGCTEQTVSRFLPAVLTLRSLQEMGISLEDVARIRGRLEEVRRREADQGIQVYADSPVFDSEYLQQIIRDSLTRIASMQNGDGGFGWWKSDASAPYLTSYVLWALCEAAACDVAVPKQLIEQAMTFLERAAKHDMAKKEWRADDVQAFVAYVLSLGKRDVGIKPGAGDDRPGRLVDRLFEERGRLTLYGKSLFALALANLEDQERARTLYENILQFAERNDETQVASFRMADGPWWCWWNDEIETHAWILRVMMRLDPKTELAPRVVKWLLNNRRNGYYWRSTRDTTLCVAALSEFVRASGEGDPAYTLTIELDDGAARQEIAIDAESLLTFDNRFVIEGAALGTGKHVLRLTKKGRGALYASTRLTYFSEEEPIPAAGHEIKIDRRYFLLRQVPYEVEVQGSKGEKVMERRLRYERVPLKPGDPVTSGDVIQVELELTSDNDYTFLALEDMKPAGCEPIDLRSGNEGQEGFWTWRELRDERVVFFLGALGQGKHLIRHRLRAEAPGAFHTLPATIYGMYAPELRANASEHLLRIVE